MRASSEIEFPANDPTRAALHVQRLAPRLDRVVELADQVKALAILGIVLGAAGVIVGLWAGRVRRSR